MRFNQGASYQAAAASTMATTTMETTTKKVHPERYWIKNMYAPVMYPGGTLGMSRDILMVTSNNFSLVEMSLGKGNVESSRHGRKIRE